MKVRIFKTIPILLLWIAGLAFCAHLTIPHDHHSEEACTENESSCPASNTKSGHNTGYPIHCHALNCLASEKGMALTLVKTVQLNEVSICDFSDFYSFGLQYHCVTIFEVAEPFHDFGLTEFSLLRAPPLVS
jgi:hypothetical protein